MTSNIGLYVGNPFANIPLKGSTVGYVRSDLLEAYKQWYRLIYDVLHGSPAVKRNAKYYVPYPNQDHLSEDPTVKANALARYQSMIDRGQFFNTTARTASGFTGLVYNKEPDIELPERYVPHVENVDGTGIGIVEQSRSALYNLLGYGRGALRVDYGSNYTVADVREGRAVPTINYIHPFELINWRTTLIRGKKTVSLVMIVETYEEDNDGYSPTLLSRLREYRLVKTGDKHRLVVKLWYPDSQNPEVFYPVKDDGTPFDYIPVFPLGAVENTFELQTPPLLDQAEVNIGHFINSVEYEDSTFMVGNPTYAAIGVNEDWVKDHLGGYIEIGAQRILPLPENADLVLRQPDPNTMAGAAMDRKEKQMVALGAKMLQDRSVARTATEATGDETVDNSVLATLARNVNKGYRLAYSACGDFSGVYLEEAQGFEINTDYNSATMAPQLIHTLLAIYQDSLMTAEEFRWLLRRAGFAYMDDANFQEKLNGEMDKKVRDSTAANKQGSVQDRIPGDGPNAAG